MAESTTFQSQTCSHLMEPLIARPDDQVPVLDPRDSQPMEASQPRNSVRRIFSKTIRVILLTFAALLTLAVALASQIIIYPIQIALGIRAYRNPNYELDKWTRRGLITLLCISVLEISSLSSSLVVAYVKGSVAPLHLSPFKWWQYIKNVLVLAVLIAEALSLKPYTRYVDGWLEVLQLHKTEDRSLEGAEKGLLLRAEVGSERETGDDAEGTIDEKHVVIVDEKLEETLEKEKPSL